MNNNLDRAKGILLESGTNEVEFLRFGCAGQVYGINVAKVCQITLYKPETLVHPPLRPTSVLGTFDFRGRSIPVVDLGSFLGLDSQQQPAQRLLLITQFNQHITGFVVDRVDGIVRCSWQEFVALDDTVFGTESANVVGTVSVDDTLVLILDVEAILGALIPSSSIAEYAGQVSSTSKIDRSKVRILYCEDSPIVQKILLKTLRDAGFSEIEVFGNGSDGLARLRSVPQGSFDVIVSDIEMPSMDGLALCRAVREQQQWQQVPFIFFSSMVDEQMKVKCERVGGQRAFAKPEVHRIVECIEELMLERK